MVNSITVTVEDIDLFKMKALQWANHFNVVCLLDSNKYQHQQYKSADWLLAVDALESLSCNAGNAFEQLKQFQKNAGSAIFGYLGYDLKNEVENLNSNNVDGLGFDDCFFFKPRYIISIEGSKVTVNRNYPETFELIELINKTPVQQHEIAPVELVPRTLKEQYLDKVRRIREQIEAGDYYEINYCNEFYNDDVTIIPLQVFMELNSTAQAPFSSYVRMHDKYLVCASPERFLRKEGSKLISQPIKGTIKKGSSKEENDALQQQLKNDIKERAENVMIVDLVRNDLSRTCVPGTVKVEELFGIYEFNAVNQMVSTVTGELKPGVHFIDAIKAAFPMGSMTGAPKVIVMENIEKYEDARRGLFSGAVGYISPEGDFDFNVVIRSIFYNDEKQYLSIQVGGAITYDSIPEKEYEEILLKANGLLKALNATIKQV
jgi:para-aminobenzoate synthetase component 1